MHYSLLADLVVVVHLAFILFVSIGGLLVLRWRKVLFLHLPAVLWGCFVEITGRGCPLTPLENWLRHAGGASGYSGGFIEHYILPVIYSSELTRQQQFVLAGALILFNVAIYVLVWRRGLRRARS